MRTGEAQAEKQSRGDIVRTGLAKRGIEAGAAERREAVGARLVCSMSLQDGRRMGGHVLVQSSPLLLTPDGPLGIGRDPCTHLRRGVWRE